VYCDLHDLGFVGPPFTWRNKRQEEDFSTARLDRIFASTSWITAFNGAVVTHLAVQKSDHCPLLLSIPGDPPVSKKKKIFRFEAMWIRDEQCKGVIEHAWHDAVFEGSPMFQVVEKLKSCRTCLIGWSRDRFGSLATKIKEKRVHLQRLMQLKVELQNKLNELLENE
jgi:hypothetical protein